MDKVITIAYNDLRIYFSQRGNLIGLVLIPIILATVLGITSVPSATTYTLDIVDLDETAQSQEFIDDILTSNEAFVHSDTVTTADESRIRVAEETVDAVIIIPEDFAEGVATFKPVNILYYSNEDVLGGAIRYSISTVITNWNSAIIATRSGELVVNALELDVVTSDIYQRASNFISQESVEYNLSLTNTEQTLQPGEGFGQSVPGFGAMFVMFTVFSGMSTLLRERQNWTLQRVIVMPVMRSQVLGGKILTYFTLGIIQYSLLFGFGALMGLQIGHNLPAILLVMVVYTLSITALSFAIANSIRTEGQASNLTTLLSISLAALGGAWWSLEVVPPFMQSLGHLSPVAWAMDAFTNLLYYNGSVEDVMSQVAVLVAITAVLFVIGVRRFRYE